MSSFVEFRSAVSEKNAKMWKVNDDGQRIIVVHLSLRRLRCTKSKMGIPTFDRLRHFRLLWNHWMEFAETWQEATTQRPLPNLCFRDKRKAKDGHHDLWLIHFRTAELNFMKLDKKQIPNVLYQFCDFFRTKQSFWPFWQERWHIVLAFGPSLCVSVSVCDTKL